MLLCTAGWTVNTTQQETGNKKAQGFQGLGKEAGWIRNDITDADSSAGVIGPYIDSTGRKRQGPDTHAIKSLIEGDSEKKGKG